MRFSKEALQLVSFFTPCRGCSASLWGCCRVSSCLHNADLRTRGAEQAIHQKEERGRIGYRNILCADEERQTTYQTRRLQEAEKTLAAHSTKGLTSPQTKKPLPLCDC